MWKQRLWLFVKAVALIYIYIYIYFSDRFFRAFRILARVGVFRNYSHGKVW